MRIENEIKLDFSDVLMRPKRSTLGSRSEVDITRQFTFKHSGRKYHGAPIVASNMDGTGTLSMAEAFRAMAVSDPSLGSGPSVALTKHYPYDRILSFYREREWDNVWYTLGSSDFDSLRLDTITKRLGDFYAPKRICVDVANGYTETFVDCVKRLRDAYPNTTIMAGNVVTADMTEALILAGADVVKCGIGGGSACLTRVQTGIGFPQLSAIIECADAAHGMSALICSDGGCNSPGDVAKAFGAGADFVMLGGMLSGTSESESEIIEIDGKQYVEFYGMSSETAQRKHGGTKNYRASEGRTIRKPFVGSSVPIMEEILGGIRSACTYTGSHSLKELSKRTTFIRVSNTHNRVFESITTGK